MMLQETLAAERAAVELAIHGRWLERWRVGLHALWRLTRDPDDTRQAFIVGAVLDRNHIAKPFLRFMMDPGGFDLMRDQPAIDSTTVDFDALAALPEGTLGHGYARHMRDNALDPDLFLSPPGAPPGIGYFAQRLRQTHDIWHVLTGLGADLPGEIALQAFMFGQFGTPAPFFTAFAGTFLCMLEDPLAARDIWRAYRRGRRAKPLLVVRWEEHWEEPVGELRARYGIEADPPAPAIAPAGAYRVDDRSLLLGLYRRLLWDRLTRAIPRAIHPNLLTIACQLFAVLAAVSCAIAIGGHPLLFLLSAIGFLGALTLDNVDGAHARRTGQCSALGELLDHGLDGVTATATLVTTGLLLRVPGPMLVAISALGAVAFATVFWEQLRTGVLRLPRVSPTEGLTLLAAWEVLLAAFGDPAWLHFSLTHVTAGTVAVLAFFVVHVLAVLTPMLRVKSAELLPLFGFGALQVGLALRGANAFVPAVAIGLTAADVTTHWLRLRHRCRSGPVLPSALYLAAVPFLLELVWPSPTVWAALSLAIVLADYATRLVRHGRVLA
ncbi:MAG: Coq4 family protein [Labilithrix sp.]